MSSEVGPTTPEEGDVYIGKPEVGRGEAAAGQQR